MRNLSLGVSNQFGLHEAFAATETSIKNTRNFGHAFRDFLLNSEYSKNNKDAD